MTRYEVALSPDTEAEIREAFLWYYERSPLAADASRTEIFEAIDSLTAGANMWPEDEAEFATTCCGTFHPRFTHLTGQ